MSAIITAIILQLLVAVPPRPQTRHHASTEDAWSAVSPLDSCAQAKRKAHKLRCPTLAEAKEVGECRCRPAGRGWLCAVDQRTTCRKRSSLVPAYVQTGTAKGESIVSRSLACHEARHHAHSYVCRTNRLDHNIEACVCELGDDGWTCLADFTLWCH